MENPSTKENLRSGERLESLAIRAASDEWRPISGSREVEFPMYPEGTRSDDGNMSSDKKGPDPGVPWATYYPRSSIDHEPPRAYFREPPRLGEPTTISAYGYDDHDDYVFRDHYEPISIPCVYPDCPKTLTRAAWTQHVYTHIIAENPTAKAYSCPCHLEPSWIHLLGHEVDSILKRGCVSSKLLKQLDTKTSRPVTAKYRGNDRRVYASVLEDAPRFSNQPSTLQFGCHLHRAYRDGQLHHPESVISSTIRLGRTIDGESLLGPRELSQQVYKPDSEQRIPRSPSSPGKAFAVVPSAGKQPIVDAHGDRAAKPKIPTGYRIPHSKENTKESSIAGRSSVPHASSTSSQPKLLAMPSISAPLPSEFTLNELNDTDESDCGDLESDDGSGCNDLYCDGGESQSCGHSREDRTDAVRSNPSTPAPRLSPSEHGGDNESYSSDREFDSGGSLGCDWSGEDGVIVHSNNTENGGERKRRRPNKTTGTRRPNPQCNERDSLSDGEEGDEDGDGESDRPQNSKPGNQGPGFYGCPYYNREPEKYQKCASCRFPSHRVRDVKFHVLRTHLKPEQCPRGCGYRDGTLALIWKHLKETNCEKATLVELPDNIVKDGKALNATHVKPTSWDHICMTIFKCPKSRVPIPDFVEHEKNGDNDEDQGSSHIPDPVSEELPTRDRAEGIRQAAPETQSDMQQSTVKKLEAQVQQLSEQLQQIHTLLNTNAQPHRLETSTNSTYTQASSQHGPERGSNALNDTSSHIPIGGSCPQSAASVSSIATTSSEPSYNNGQHEHQSLPPMDSEDYNLHFPYGYPEADAHTRYPNTSMYGGSAQVSFTNDLAASHPTNNVLPSGPVPHHHPCHCQDPTGPQRNKWLQGVPQNTVYPTDPHTLDSQPLSGNLPKTPHNQYAWEDFLLNEEVGGGQRTR